MSSAAWWAVLVAGLLVVIAAAAGISGRRRAGIARMCGERGWTVSRERGTVVVTPADGSWSIRSVRSFASQMSPPSTHIVTSVWSAASPADASISLLAGPSPAGPARDLAIAAFAALPGRAKGWLGVDHISHGRDLRALDGADHRLLVFAAGDTADVGALSGVADAVDAWCGRYRSEREQPAVSLDGDGLRVRVRADVTRSPAHLAAFAELGEQCRRALTGRPG